MIALFSFSLPQFNNNWTTDLGGIPICWFPASWSLRERKQREKFQAVSYDLLDYITTSELGVKSFKIVQTGKGKRKLVGFFEKWESVHKVLDTHQVLSSEGIKLPWYQHSTPNLKKLPKAYDRSG